MIMYLAQDIPAFVTYCVNGESNSSQFMTLILEIEGKCYSAKLLKGFQVVHFTNIPVLF